MREKVEVQQRAMKKIYFVLPAPKKPERQNSWLHAYRRLLQKEL
jgi:hypothetical protein